MSHRQPPQLPNSNPAKSQGYSVVIANQYAPTHATPKQMQNPHALPPTQRMPPQYATAVSHPSNIHHTLQALVASSRNDERVVNEKTNELKVLQQAYEELSSVKRDFSQFVQFSQRQVELKSADAAVAKARLQDIQRLRAHSKECLDHHAELVVEVTQKFSLVKSRLALQQERLVAIQNRLSLLNKLKERIAQETDTNAKEIADSVSKASALRESLSGIDTEIVVLSEKLRGDSATQDKLLRAKEKLLCEIDADTAARSAAKLALDDVKKAELDVSRQLESASKELARVGEDIRALEDFTTERGTLIARRETAECEQAQLMEQQATTTKALEEAKAAKVEIDVAIASLDAELRACRVEKQLLEAQVEELSLDELTTSLRSTADTLKLKEDEYAAIQALHKQLASLASTVETEGLSEECGLSHEEAEALLSMQAEFIKAQDEVKSHSEIALRARTGELDALKVELAQLTATIAACNATHEEATQTAEGSVAIDAEIANCMAKVSAERDALSDLQAQQTKLLQEIGVMRAKADDFSALQKENEEFDRAKERKLAQHYANNVEPAKAQTETLCNKLKVYLESAEQMLIRLDEEEAAAATAAAAAHAAAQEAEKLAAQERAQAELHRQQAQQSAMQKAQLPKEIPASNISAVVNEPKSVKKTAPTAAVEKSSEKPPVPVNDVVSIDVLGSIDEMELPQPTVFVDEPMSSGYRSPPFKQRYTPFQPSPQAQKRPAPARATPVPQVPVAAREVPSSPVSRPAQPASPPPPARTAPAQPAAPAASAAVVAHSEPVEAADDFMTDEEHSSPQRAEPPRNVTPSQSRLTKYTARKQEKAQTSVEKSAAKRATDAAQQTIVHVRTKDETRYETPRRSSSAPQVASSHKAPSEHVTARIPHAHDGQKPMMLKNRMSPTMQRAQSPQPAQVDDGYDLTSASQKAHMLSVQKQRVSTSPASSPRYPVTPTTAHHDDENSQPMSGSDSYDQYDDSYSLLHSKKDASARSALAAPQREGVVSPAQSTAQATSLLQKQRTKTQTREAKPRLAAPARATGTAKTLKSQQTVVQDAYKSRHLLSAHLSKLNAKSAKTNFPIFSDSSDDSDEDTLVTYRTKSPTSIQPSASSSSPSRIISKYANQETPLQRFAKQKPAKPSNGNANASANGRKGLLSTLSPSDDPYELDIFS